MRVLRLALALVFALLVHLGVVAIGPAAAGVVDPFLILIAFYALDGRLMTAVVVGCVAGLTEDVVSNGLFGLHGLAGTIVGYVAGRSAQLLSLDRGRFVAMLFAFAALVQQLSVYLLLLVLGARQEAPPVTILALRVVVTAVAGTLLTGLVDRTARAARARRQQRQPRVSWGTE